MGSFKINGGKSLKGIIHPQGAKNEALQILCAVLLTEEVVTIENIPDIKDVNLLIDLLDGMGVEIEKIDSTSYSFKASSIDINYTKSDEFLKNHQKLEVQLCLWGHL